jgi:thioesterase domain-containing protein
MREPARRECRDVSAPALDGMEARLAGIWTEILGVSPGRDDSFFDLGGDSLSVVEMLARAADAGLSLELAAVFAGKTLGELVSESRREPAAERSEDVSVQQIWAGLPALPPGAARTVTVHQGAGAAPFFSVHWGTGNAAFLARVPPDPLAMRKMIGVEAVGLHDGARPLLDPEEVAGHVARAVIDYGTARVHLGGFCYGALIALTAARQVSDAGIEVASLVLADAVPPDPRDFPPDWTVDDFLRFRLGMVAQRYGTDRARCLAQMTHLGVADPDEPAERFLMLQALWAANSYVQARWRLAHFAGPVLLVASEAHHADAVPSAWREWLVPQRVTHLYCHDAPESHDLLASPTFHDGLHRHLRSTDRQGTA